MVSRPFDCFYVRLCMSTLQYFDPREVTMGKLIDMPDPDYFAYPALDQSRLKTFLRNPADWGWEWLGGSASEPTDAMKFGTAFHAYLLETDPVVCLPEGETFASKKNKEWRDEQLAAGNIIVSYKDMQTLKRMKHNLETVDGQMDIIRNGLRENAIFWKDKKTGLPLKAKLDLIPRDVDYLVDIKTATDASPDGFRKSAFDHGYWIQAEFYRAAIAQVNPKKLHRAHRIASSMEFWTFEKTGACDWAKYSISADNPMAANARASIRQALNRIKDAVRQGEDEDLGEGLDAAARWSVKHGYPKGVRELDFTEWELTAAERFL